MRTTITIEGPDLWTLEAMLRQLAAEAAFARTYDTSRMQLTAMVQRSYDGDTSATVRIEEPR